MPRQTAGGFMGDIEALSAVGSVLGARVPITLTGRADDSRSQIASIALLQLVAHMYRRAAVSAPR